MIFWIRHFCFFDTTNKLKDLLWIYPAFTNFESLWNSLTKYMEVSPLNLPSEQIGIQTNNPNPWKFMRWKPKLWLVSSESSLSPDLFSTACDFHFLFSRLIFLKCEERRAWTSYKIMSTTRFLLNRLGKVSKDSRSSFPIYEIGNALEYFVFSSNISEIQSRRRCRVFVSLILLHKITWPSVNVKILILFRCASISWIHVEESVTESVINVFEILSNLGLIFRLFSVCSGYV